jgi:hypothetical protein
MRKEGNKGMDSPDRINGEAEFGRIRSALSGQPVQRIAGRLTTLLTTFVPPLVQVQLPRYALLPVLAALGALAVLAVTRCRCGGSPGVRPDE